MANARKLPSGKWNIQIRVKGFPQKTITRETREECEQAAREYERGLVSKGSNTVESLSAEYLETIKYKNGRIRGGYETAVCKLATIGRIFNGKPLEQLSKEDVLSLKAERLEAVSGSTVRLDLQLLGRFLRWCIEEKGIECIDATQGVKLPEAGKPRSKVVEPLELQMILDHAPERARDFLSLSYETAMRRNEQLFITPRMVNLSKRIISLPAEICKNGEAREVPLTKKAVAILERLCDGREKDSKIFNYSPYGITQAFRRAARLAGVRDVCLHSLRHTAITNAAEKGLNVVQLMTVSGHKTISMLARYSHLKASKVAELLD